MTEALARLLFRHRAAVLVLFLVATLAFGIIAARARVDASFTHQLPYAHPFVEVALQHREQVGGANRVLIALFPRQGDIFQPAFFATLQAATDAVFFVPGIDRSQVSSLFTPNTRYLEVVSEGFAGGPVLPPDFQPDAEGFARVRENLNKSGKVGQLVTRDFRGAMISAQLLDRDPRTGEAIDPATVAETLELRVRKVFENEATEVALIGFAPKIQQIREGARDMAGFFGLSVLITVGLVRLFARSWKLTWPLILCSLVAVVWQVGALTACGLGFDPFALLVPFLVFAMAVSHGVQMVRVFRHEVMEGATPLTGGQQAFRQLLQPGGIALLSDSVGFLTLMLIQVRAIQNLALGATLGVAAIILTHLVLLPVLLSYQNLTATFLERVRQRQTAAHRHWERLSRLLRPAPSLGLLVGALGLGVWAWEAADRVVIGDTHPGAPELHGESRYNQDTRRIVGTFDLGVDVFTVIAETAPNGCVAPGVLDTLDQLEGNLRELPQVQSVLSLATVAKGINAAWNEGVLAWRILPVDTEALAQTVAPVETATGLLNAEGSVLPVLVFLKDHRADTLTAVTRAVESFIAEQPASSPVRLRLASGNAGLMAATNQVVEQAQSPMLAWVFGAITLLCLVTFRSWRATLCIMLPLLLVSLLAYALMAGLGIGLKTSTLPVAALGAGIGVDYAIYLYAALQRTLRQGTGFEAALHQAYTQAGSSILFTALALALGVGTWVFSSLKFQADMGVLLLFLFLVNLIGALLLMPALARWLFRHPRHAALHS